MADKTQPGGKPRLFRCRGVQQIGAGQDGGFAYVEMVEVDGEVMALGFPPGAAGELANRIMSAGDLAVSQQLAAKPPTERQIMPAPLVTEHMAVPSEDGDTITLSLMTGPVSLVVRLSKSRSEKLRASLDRCEAQIASDGTSA